MTNKIIEAARSAGGTTYTNRHFPGETACAFGPEALARFYALAYRQGLEAGKSIAITTASPYADKYGEGYNQAALDIEKRIDALMKENHHG